MEPARKKVEFELIEGASVIICAFGEPMRFPLAKLGNELFAVMGKEYVQLFKDGFTDSPWRWEHFPDPPINIICNSLGRMVCQN